MNALKKKIMFVNLLEFFTKRMLSKVINCYCADCVGRQPLGTAPRMFKERDLNLANPDGCMCIYCYAKHKCGAKTIEECSDKLREQITDEIILSVMIRDQYRTYIHQEGNIYDRTAVRRVLEVRNKYPSNNPIMQFEDINTRDSTCWCADCILNGKWASEEFVEFIDKWYPQIGDSYHELDAITTQVDVRKIIWRKDYPSDNYIRDGYYLFTIQDENHNYIYGMIHPFDICIFGTKELKKVCCILRKSGNFNRNKTFRHDEITSKDNFVKNYDILIFLDVANILTYNNHPLPLTVESLGTELLKTTIKTCYYGEYRGNRAFINQEGSWEIISSEGAPHDDYSIANIIIQHRGLTNEQIIKKKFVRDPFTILDQWCYECEKYKGACLGHSVLEAYLKIIITF